MKTLGQILSLSYEYATSKNPGVLRSEVDEIIAGVVGLKRLDLYLNFERPLEEQELCQIRKLLTRLTKGEPLQYIEGKTSFYHCTIAVNKYVLIPRQETELIVEHIIHTIQQRTSGMEALWDICTGSGCIGISIKKHLPNLDVSLSDISKEALELASMNAKSNSVNVQIFQGDLFMPFIGARAKYIVSNPPYISKNEMNSLSQSVKDFEPHLALYGGIDGLDFYKKIAGCLAQFLEVGGVAWFEIGQGQVDSVTKIFEGKGFKASYILYDYAKIARAIQVEYQTN